ncbi:MAG: peptidoglycan-binding protein [Chloroflexota bacterium]
MAIPQEVLQRYFVVQEDAQLPSRPVPATFMNSKVTPLLTSESYGQALLNALNEVGTGSSIAANQEHFILMASWWPGLAGGAYAASSEQLLLSPEPTILTPDYRLDGAGGTQSLISILKQKAQAGVDVRMLGAVSYITADRGIAILNNAGTTASFNAFTMASIRDLRSEPQIGAKATLNVIAHPAGSVHTRIILIGTGTTITGFTGSVDFHSGHWPESDITRQEWHEVEAQIEGAAAKALYDWYRFLWQTNRNHDVLRFRYGDTVLPHILDDTPELPARQFPTEPVGTIGLQSIRTIPKIDPEDSFCFPSPPPLPDHPQGTFEYSRALQKAIANAQSYIYLEDRYLWSQEIMSWIREAIKNNASLRVILVMSGQDWREDNLLPIRQILSQSINQTLLAGLSDAQRNQLRVFRRWGNSVKIRDLTIQGVSTEGSINRVTTDIEAANALDADALGKRQLWLKSQNTFFSIRGNDAVGAGNSMVVTVANSEANTSPNANTSAELWQTVGVIIGGQTVIIDDQWALIGSTNGNRRSLYIDFEHGITFADENAVAVRELRKQLWSKHFQHSAPGDFEVIEASLHAWNNDWGMAGSAPARPQRSADEPGPPYLEEIELPITPELPLADELLARYNLYLDPVSDQGSTPPAQPQTPIYGNYTLQRGDRDRGFVYGGSARSEANGDRVPSDPAAGFVQELQNDLSTLGFGIVGNADGGFGRRSEWAVREFQIYAKMSHTAQEANAQPAGTTRYIDRLSQVEIPAAHRYTGPVSGVTNRATREAIKRWVRNRWRCPVVIGAYQVAGGNLGNVFNDHENIWLHNEVANSTPRMYAVDYSQHYTFPAGRDPQQLFVLGDYVPDGRFGGPRSVPPRHTWTEGEILPRNLVGVNLASLSDTQRSTFKVVRAVSEVECYGYYDSVNAYDNALISIGPCHWTLGLVGNNVVGEGELCGYLAYLYAFDQPSFNQAFEFFGLRIDEAWRDSNGVLNGNDLFINSLRKYAGWVAVQQEDSRYQRLRANEDEGNYFKSWHWFYRFIMAGRTVSGYQRRMWHMARMRIRDIRNTQFPANVVPDVPQADGSSRRATIGDVYTSERAIGIILRWHVRVPARNIRNGRVARDLLAAYRRAQIPSAAGSPPDWTNAHEQDLIQGLMDQARPTNYFDTIEQVHNWPNRPNTRNWQLPNMGDLSADRDSFAFDDSDLPPTPY